MKTYAVIRKADSVKVHEYESDAAVEWQGLEFSTHDHVEQVALPAPGELPDDPKEWHINVGPFFDRFGAYKIAILASADPVVQAIIKDATVRKYVDLKQRRPELAMAIAMLQAKGFPVTASAVLDVKPNADEVFNG